MKRTILVLKTKAPEDLVGVNVDSDMQEGGVIDDQNQGEDSQQNPPNAEDVSKEIGEVVLHQGVEKNETNERLRVEMEKEGDDLLESNVQPCSVRKLKHPRKDWAYKKITDRQ